MPAHAPPAHRRCAARAARFGSRLARGLLPRPGLLLPSTASGSDGVYELLKWPPSRPRPYATAVPVVSAADWARGFLRDPKQDAIDYLQSLFPIVGWISRYNPTWFLSDLIAGLTVGMVLVPQSMSYAQIATLPAQYGLYSSFVGVACYCFFATSKDVSIGPVAVMSLTVAQIIKNVSAAYPGVWDGPQIATAVSFLCGCIVLALGLLRLGWLVEFIPGPAVSGFMTGSAISIVSGQVPALLGVSGFDTRAETFRVILGTLTHLDTLSLDAVFGLGALLALYAVRGACTRLAARYPHRAQTFFFISVLRHALVLIALTLTSWLYCRGRRGADGRYPIRVLQTVPGGLGRVGAPAVDARLARVLAGELPVATVILLLEHIAIAKTFGRVNGYKIDPSQELLAIGVTNAVGSLFSAFPATGSFSRSALLSLSGVRTPLAGLSTASLVLVSLYGLTPAFFWIPRAALAALIVHAVADLIALPSTWRRLWAAAPVEALVWAGAVAVTVGARIEWGVWAAVGAEVALLLGRVARPGGAFLGRVRASAGRGGDEEESAAAAERDVWVPLDHPIPGAGEDGEGAVRVERPAPGVLVYRPGAGVVFPNAARVGAALVEHVRRHTRRGKELDAGGGNERAWNDPGPEAEAGRAYGLGLGRAGELGRPVLRAIVLDFAGVSSLDASGAQALADCRADVERWAGCTVEFHFAPILSPWTRRALVSAGFGVPVRAASLDGEDEDGDGDEDAMGTPYRDDAPAIPAPALVHSAPSGPRSAMEEDDEEPKWRSGSSTGSASGRTSPAAPPSVSNLSSTATATATATATETASTRARRPRRPRAEELVPRETPFFHVDLHAAVRAAEGPAAVLGRAGSARAGARLGEQAMV